VTVDLPEDALDGPVWAAVCDLADGVGDGWVLIGARMVEVHGLAAGRASPRRSADVDTLFDPKVLGSRPADAARWLTAHGYAMDGISPDGVGHRFTHDRVSIDVLAPDRLGDRADLGLVDGARTIPVPSGRRVLNHRSTIDVRLGRRRAVLPLPSIAGALIAKSAAVAVDDAPRNQRIDLAFLYSLVDDPAAVATELGAAGRKALARRQELGDRGHEAWRGLGRYADDGYDAYRFLAASRP
jgi:hypothetical protein